ncbi:MAG: redox-sensing transcriptional repressor Rex [Chloroflexi bacterium]|nr:redox-sensing transcriptional repressor Rex [Chloroflexota bacterium]
MGQGDVPDIVVGRLPIYLRALKRLQADGHEITSSHELSRRLGISSAQIRKDLSHFGEFGKQGTGYHISALSNALEGILHVDREWHVALVGVGDLGRALAHYGGFVDRGFRISLLFDSDPAKIGQKIGDLTIRSLDDLAQSITENGIKMAMIATPAGAAQEVANHLVAAGVRSILSYAPIVLSIPDEVHVQYIDPVIHLQKMAFYLD